MVPTDSFRKIREMIISAVIVALIVILTGIFFDYYYEFNDDVLMKDILSGAYTGSPAALNIQMLSPISAFISFLYRIVPVVPWYGLFLCICHFLCVWMLLHRALFISHGRLGRVTSIATVVLFTLGILLPHFVLAQYTVTVAVMAATAAFYFYTIPMGLSMPRFCIHSVPSALLLILAFQVRSEMLLLMLPYVGLAFIARLSREEKILTSDTIRRYIQVAVMVFLGILISFYANRLAYGSAEWNSFLKEFDARTQLYDYQYVPDYEENESFYESIGLGRSDVALLANYDYGIDSAIDADVMDEVAKYADSLRPESSAERMKGAVREYFYRMLHFKDRIYQIIVVFLYVMLILAILARKESTPAHKAVIICIRAVGLMVFRTIPWLYILYGRRTPDRIIHSLYIIEMIILFAMVITEYTSKLREKEYLRLICAIVLIVGGLIELPVSIGRLNSRIALQESVNVKGDAIDEYCKANPSKFYYLDVYSTIIEGETFNEKMFVDRDDSFKNYDLIGGWIMNSPLYREKIDNFGFSSAADALLYSDNVLLISSEKYDTDWITDYYRDEGVDTVVTRIDDIEGGYGVYMVTSD